MDDYSIYYKQSAYEFSTKNPDPKKKKIIKPASKLNREGQICFKVILFQRSVNVVVCKDSSLEDLYIKIYNAVYPEFSTEKMYDSIPPPNASVTFKKIPKIYCVSVINENENIASVPLHRHISIDAFMKTKRDYFKNTSFFGVSTYKIYVIDESFLEKSKKSSSPKTPVNYVQKFLQCYTKSRSK
jgi:hypothetical protein